MYFAAMKTTPQHRTAVRAFGGLDRRAGAALGTFEEMENMTGEAYPALRARAKRSTVATLSGHGGGMAVKDALLYVDGTHLYCNGIKTNLTLTEGDKQLISMGAYLLIWPDKCYLNTADLRDCGSIESAVTTEGSVRLVPVAAEEDEEGQTSHMALECGGIGVGFSAGEGVYLSGLGAVVPDGTYQLLACEADRIVIPLPLTQEHTVDAPVTVRRFVPEMDFVCECGNRLWGCKYGVVNGETVNAVYGSALGDFRSWNSFQGLASDSYAASRGSDGVFTAACPYLGSVLFFKEHCIERLYIAQNGAHQIVTLECDGVAAGSHRSLAMCAGVLYYHGSGGVYAFDGSLPRCVSEALGDFRGTGGVGGALDEVYYLSVVSAQGARTLLTLDTRRGLWHRQDDLAAVQFARRGGELFAMTDSAIVAMKGTVGNREVGDVVWSAQTTPIGIGTVGERYLSRVEVELETALGAAAAVAVSYDGGQTWHHCGTVEGRGCLRRATVAVRAVRAAHLKLRILGVGPCTVHALHAVYEQ
ncbi:MAG: hypothetical protein IKV99_05770 [Oscillospiraceae bacterium]|nr:hypothetical protein [Oscillospiraceae bacterium]